MIEDMTFTEFLDLLNQNEVHWTFHDSSGIEGNSKVRKFTFEITLKEDEDEFESK